MASSPPTGVQDWDFSYAAKLQRETGQSKFRWRLGDEEWLCDQIAGMCAMDSVSQKGHITVRAEVVFQDVGGKVTAFVYPDTEAETEAPEGEELPESQWRLCANLAGADDDKWRLRDERSDPRAPYVTHVRGYVGQANLSWMDGGSHVFHTGRIVVDKDRVAHLLP